MRASEFKRAFIATLLLLSTPKFESTTTIASRRFGVASRSGDHLRVGGLKRSRKHVPSVKIACAHHAVRGVWFATQGSSGQSGSPGLVLPLWSLITTGGLVLATSARAAVVHLAKVDEEGGPPAAAEESVKGAMIGFIKAYKKELSPLMPPACRFLPTCSVYAVEAIEKFGPAKGAVLTAWRLLRCNPFAGYGTDHPRWPPPGWFAGEKW